MRVKSMSKKRVALPFVVFGVIIDIIITNMVVLVVYAEGANCFKLSGRGVETTLIGVRDHYTTAEVADTEHLKAVFEAIHDDVPSETPVPAEDTEGMDETRVTNSLYIGIGDSETYRDRATEIFRELYSEE